MKHLRRQVIIREYDYKRMVESYIPILYTRSTFTPFTLKDLEQQYFLQVLTEPAGTTEKKKYEIPENYEYPRTFLWYLKDSLYNSKYTDWFSEYDDNGYLWIQARRTTPKSKLGWGVFEFDY